MAAVEKVPNYTDEMVQTAVRMYENRGEKGNGVIDEIAATLARGRRSVIAKLVREGVYVPEARGVATAKKQEPTKGEIIAKLADYLPAGYNVDGLLPAQKTSLAALLEFFEEGNEN